MEKAPVCPIAFKEKVKKARARERKLYPIFALVIIVSTIMIKVEYGFFLSLVVCWGIKESLWKEVNKIIADADIVKAMLAEHFQILEYDRHKAIDRKVFGEAQLNYSWETSENRDYLRARYRGLEFLFANVELYTVQLNMSSRSSAIAQKLVFQGPWLIITSQKKVEPPLVVSQIQTARKKKDGFWGGLPIQSKSDILMEDIRFQEKFWVFTEEPLNAYRILSPQFMEQLLSAKDLAKVWKHVCFTQNRVHIALHKRRLLFRPCRKRRNVHAFFKNMEEDIAYLKDILDIFLQNEALFHSQEKGD